jgi:hypothetical protein
MRSNGLKCALALFCGLATAAANAATEERLGKQPFADADHVLYSPARSSMVPKAVLDLISHGGPVIVSAKVVFIFWGPSFNNAASTDFSYARTLQSFRNQLGTSGSYNIITQYSGIQLSNLAAGTPDWFDASTPPTNVTDSAVQSKVNQYLSSHGGNDPSTVYEVVIPSSSYSSSGSSTSCGGPRLSYCSYHGWIGSGSTAIKYSIQPYPSCSGCQISGWSSVQNEERAICHETREAVTDPTGATWLDSNGNEVDDKCASTSGFPTSPGVGCGPAWSNLAHACVKSR